jgi:hypothetical protein
MRKMTDGKTVVNISEWVILKNFWEYYVIDKWDEKNCSYCLVDGDFQEIGLVSLDEIKPYISSRTRILTDLQPAPGWNWV